MLSLLALSVQLASAVQLSPPSSPSPPNFTQSYSSYVVYLEILISLISSNQITDGAAAWGLNGGIKNPSL
jgi:uncharacterized RDD family membrane protein YckC